MRARAAGLLLLMVASPGAGSAAVQWAPDTAMVRALPGYVFAWSPGGARLAFAQGRELWIAGPDDWQGGRRFTFEQWDADATIEQLVWAPDGNTIAVVTPRALDQWQSIWLVDVQSGELLDLLPPEVSDVFGSPGIRAVRVGTWIDAGNIAFIQRCGTGCVSVHRVSVEPRVYSHYCVAGVDRDFAWDPSGAWAIFGGHLGALGFIDLDQPGSEQWRECNIVLPAYDPQTSDGNWYDFETAAANGREVVLRRHTGDAETTGLAAWDFRGLPTDLVSGAVLASWSPDSRRIAFVKLERNAVGTLDAELALLEISGGVRIVAPLGSVVPGLLDGDWLARPAWSPDSRSLVAQDRSGRAWLLQADMAVPPRELFRGDRARAVWSADSRWLVVQVADSGVPEIGTAYLLRVGDDEP